MYKVFRLIFYAGLHIGEGSLSDCSIRLRADTIFSAMCIEALKIGGEDMIHTLVNSVEEEELAISDAFPFIDDELYISKPFFQVESDGNVSKKIFKKLNHIPVDMAADYLDGAFDEGTANYITNKLSKLGKQELVAHAAVRTGGDALPYNVGVFTFAKNNGLYVIAGGVNLDLCRTLLHAVAKTGIGGKRSAGLGRFSLEETPLDDEIAKMLTGDHKIYTTLSVSLPTDDEIDNILPDASYSLLKRSGFVFSETYATEFVRKKDLYVLDSGSVVYRKFSGSVVDVSNKGSHPVYRYAKPMFLGVDLCI